MSKLALAGVLLLTSLGAVAHEEIALSPCTVSNHKLFFLEGKPASNSEWSGACKAGKSEGLGIAVQKEGDAWIRVLAGKAQAGLISGKGVTVKHVAYEYKGTFKRGKPDAGVLYFGGSSGLDRFEGRFKEGALARGALYFKNGDILIGKFVKNKPTGETVAYKKSTGYYYLVDCEQSCNIPKFKGQLKDLNTFRIALRNVTEAQGALVAKSSGISLDIGEVSLLLPN